MANDNQQLRGEAWERFTRLWVKAQPALSTFIATVIVDANDAEDVLQNVALSASRDFDQYDPARPFLPWALTIARHRVIDHHRTRQRRGRHFSATTVERLAAVCEKTMPGAVTDEHDRVTALRSCVKQLPANHQRVLGLRYHADMPCAKIAERMGTSCNAIFLMLSRVRTKLAECIQHQLRKAGDT